jgi:hypothetical protein
MPPIFALQKKLGQSEEHLTSGTQPAPQSGQLSGEPAGGIIGV